MKYLLVQQEHLTLCLNLFMWEVVFLQLEHATMLSFPDIQDPQHQDQEVPVVPRDARTHLCPWTSFNSQVTAVLCRMGPQLGFYTGTCGDTGT